ncbi:hypothetical protein JCM10207_005033 [Rhodosporidiobolus poonsookiae]
MSHHFRVEGDEVYEGDHLRGEYGRVQAGYKAAAHNARNSDETREEAQTILDDLTSQHSSSSPSAASKPHDTRSSSTTRKHAHPAHEYTHATRSHDHDTDPKKEDREKDMHHHRVIGGLKANLHRDDRSEETKDKIRERLHELGEDEA